MNCTNAGEALNCKAAVLSLHKDENGGEEIAAFPCPVLRAFRDRRRDEDLK